MASRRDQARSDESDASRPSVHTTIHGLASLELLDKLVSSEHEEKLRQELIAPPGNASPVVALSRLLSLRPVVSTASSSSSSSSSLFALHHQQQSTLPNDDASPTPVNYRVIGFGQCGLVFERPGRGHVAKLARPFFKDGLWDDFQAHFQVYNALCKWGAHCRTPQVFSYVPQDNKKWWDVNGPLFGTISQGFTIPTMALITERILPLTKTVRHALITQYCPPSHQDNARNNAANRDCLARIYLGRHRQAGAPLSPNFTLRNFNLHLDQMLELNLPVELYAGIIGQALAVMHWTANVDCYDIEFVLGSQPEVDDYTSHEMAVFNFTAEQVASMDPHTDVEALMRPNLMRRATKIWVLDFNLCHRWNERIGWERPDALIPQLVDAFFENDPYYPLPLPEQSIGQGQSIDQELWNVFSKQYLATAQNILANKDIRLGQLPSMFIDQCVAREQANIDKGLGRGHREKKG